MYLGFAVYMMSQREQIDVLSQLDEVHVESRGLVCAR